MDLASFYPWGDLEKFEKVSNEPQKPLSPTGVIGISTIPLSCEDISIMVNAMIKQTAMLSSQK
jgi:hypothetical protein